MPYSLQNSDNRRDRSGPHMKIVTSIITRILGKKAGEDRFGNKYYVLRRTRRGRGSLQTERRIVIYKGMPEPSKVPPEWHGWLHHTFDTPPEAGAGPVYDWQRDHQPNLSGTALAYRPPGANDAKQAEPQKDYEAWTPN